MRLSLPVKIIGVDLDTKKRSVRNVAEGHMNEVGTITVKYETNHGFHYRIKLKKPCGFKKSIQIRDYCGDDWLRCYFDIKRRWKGSSYNDMLYNYKKKL